MRGQIALLVTCLSAGVVAQAEQSPGVREIIANERIITPVTTRLRYTTVIVVPEGEEITESTCGDKDNWVINADGRHAFVKPAKEGAATNLNLLTTTGAIYSFTLREDAKAQTDLKLYVMPDPDAKAKPQKYVAATTLNELADALAAIKADIREANTKAQTQAVAIHADEQAARAAYPGTLKFDYSWDAKKNPFSVKQIWHDGVRTFIRSDKPEQGAALYEVTSSGPSLVNFDLENGLYVATKVLKKGELVVGKDRFEFAATK